MNRAQQMELIEELLAKRPHLRYNERAVHETVFDTRIWIRVEQLGENPTLKDALGTIERCIPDEEKLAEVVERFVIQYEINWRHEQRKLEKEAEKAHGVVTAMTPATA